MLSTTFRFIKSQTLGGKIAIYIIACKTESQHMTSYMYILYLLNVVAGCINRLIDFF